MIREQIEEILAKVAPEGTTVELSVPEREEFGHYATSLAMKMAGRRLTQIDTQINADGCARGPTRTGPLTNADKGTGGAMQIAEELKAKIEKIAPKGFFEKVEVAPPGFINFWVTEKAAQKEFAEIAQNERYGSLELLRGKRVMVEYTDPNPFKQFHIGHLMTNMIGESIARLHEAAGAEVVRVTWQGDVGVHVASSVWGIMRLGNEMPSESAALAEKAAFLGKAYATGATAYREDPTAKAEIDAINKKIYERSDAEINKLYDEGRHWSLEYFETMYARLGSKFVRYFFESEEGPKGLALVKAHPEVFTESQGAVIFKGEDYGLHTRVFINAQGIPTYEAKELGLNQEKFKLFHPDLSVIVTGNEINEYFRVLMKAMELVLPEVAAKTKHIGHGMLRLPTGKMSSRTGKVITAESLIDDIKEAVGPISTLRNKRRLKKAWRSRLSAIRCSGRESGGILFLIWRPQSLSTEIRGRICNTRMRGSKAY